LLIINFFRNFLNAFWDLSPIGPKIGREIWDRLQGNLKFIYRVIFYLFIIYKLISIISLFYQYIEIIFSDLYFKNCMNLSFSGIENNTNINTNNFNFNTLSLTEKYNYLKLKFFNKAIEPNIPFLDWFVQLLVNTDGSINNVDHLIETNLNAIQKIERETQLNSHSFSRIKPFLINRTDISSTKFPNMIPYKNKNFLIED